MNSETRSRDIINNKWLFITSFTISWIKYIQPTARKFNFITFSRTRKICPYVRELWFDLQSMGTFFFGGGGMFQQYFGSNTQNARKK